MLEKVFFKKDFRIFSHKDEFIFHPGVNLLVGDQGTGKSTLFYLLAGNRQFSNVIQYTTTANSSVPIRFFDFEKHNPRSSSALYTENEDKLNAQLGLMFSSHGQGVNAIIKAATQFKAPMVLMMDEPDMALSPRSAKKLVETFQLLSQKGIQIIAAVHNPIVIESVDQVLSLEHKKWMSSREFLTQHLK